MNIKNWKPTMAQKAVISFAAFLLTAILIAQSSTPYMSQAYIDGDDSYDDHGTDDYTDDYGHDDPNHDDYGHGDDDFYADCEAVGDCDEGPDHDEYGHDDDGTTYIEDEDDNMPQVIELHEDINLLLLNAIRSEKKICSYPLKDGTGNLLCTPSGCMFPDGAFCRTTDRESGMPSTECYLPDGTPTWFGFHGTPVTTYDNPNADYNACTPTCDNEYAPVCAKDGNTFQNRCLLDQASEVYDHNGECVSDQEAEKLTLTPEMERVMENLGKEMETFMRDFEEAEKGGLNLSSVERILNEIEKYNEEKPDPTYEEEFWNGIDFFKGVLGRAQRELKRIESEAENASKVSSEELRKMQEALNEIDEGMGQLAGMLGWFESLGADMSEMEDLFEEIGRLYVTAEDYLYNEDVDAFWKAMDKLNGFLEDDFQSEFERILLDSDIGQFFEQMGREMESIDEAVAELETNGEQVPDAYYKMQDMGAMIGEAFESGDFESATDLIDEIVMLIDEFWSELGEDHTLGFEPPAGFEGEVITLSTRNPFPDMDASSLEGIAAADLYKRAVIGGFPDGEFKGKRSVNRAEAAKFLLLASGIDVQELENKGRFKDIPEGQWYVKYVMTAAEMGIIGGYSDETFRPANTVNTAEFLKMLSLAFRAKLNLDHTYRDVPEDAWFAKYAGMAKTYELFPKRKYNLLPAKELTRNEVAVAIYQYLVNR